MSIKNNTNEATQLTAYNTQSINSTTIWVLFLFLGWSYGSMNQMGKQILFYLTLGGFGIWTLIRLFTLNGAIKEYNRKLAMRIGMDAQQITMLGLY